jgi:hypothetical protein
VSTYSTQGRHLALHQAVAKGLEEHTESRNVSLRLTTVVGESSEDVLRECGASVEEWMHTLDPDDVPEKPRPTFEFNRDGLFVRVEAHARAETRPLPVRFPLVQNGLQPD